MAGAKAAAVKQHATKLATSFDFVTAPSPDPPPRSKAVSESSKKPMFFAIFFR
jgi:hypothetical protein